MRKVIAGMQISLDAKIEGPDGHADWVSEDDWGDTYGLPPLVDACVLGHRMYPGYEAYWNAIALDPSKPLELTGRLPTEDEIAYAAFAVATPHYVLSHHGGEAVWPTTKFIDSVEAVRGLREKPGKSIYVVGGAETVAHLLDADLIDELRFTLHPLVAGRGLALFDKVERRHLLELVSAAPDQRGRVSLRYSVKRGPNSGDHR